MEFFKKLSLIPRGLRYKLLIAFSLMSIIPLLASIYIVRDHLFSPTSDILNISWVLFFCLIITFLGLILAKQMIEPIIEMAIQARMIANGDLNRQMSVSAEDEIGDLGRAVNEITRNIKSKIEELKLYGEKTKLVNIEIHKKVLVLSGLLQIGEHMSGFAEMRDVMSLIVEKMTQLMDVGYAALFFPCVDGDLTTFGMVASNNVDAKGLSNFEIKIGKGFLGNALACNVPVCCDAKTKLSSEMQEFIKENKVKNFAGVPLVSKKKPIGMLFVGNDSENFEFKEDDFEILKIFAKQATIAYEGSLLRKKTKELEIKDDLTDLYNKKYIAERLEEEIKRSILYQRPCSYIVFDVDDLDKFRIENGELAVEKALKKLALIFSKHAGQIGKAARISGNSFAILLPEKNKREAYKIAEEVRVDVEKAELKGEKLKYLTVSAGVSENPIDGANAAELMKKAAAGVLAAAEQGKNRII